MHMGPRVRQRIGGCALLVTSLVAPCVRGQAVRGQLVGQSVQLPVTGALVLLVDHTGRQINRTVTNESGRFLVAASNAGEFSLLVLRIGYQTWQSPTFRLTVGDTLEYRGEVQETPIRLPAISVEARRQCRLAQDAGEMVAALWDEAKKALMLTEATSEHSAFEFRIVRSTRRVNNSLAILEETSDTALLTTYSPFISLPADSLAHAGFVQDSAGVTIYYGPDVPVLFSDAFLRRHCFRLTPAPSAAPKLVGLAFEPTRGEVVPEIAGVLWLERETARLKYVEYRYTNLEPELADRAGGRIEFLRLPTGAWIVQRWWIQTPIRLRNTRGPMQPASSRNYRVQERRVLEVLTTDGRSVVRVRDEP